MKLKLAFTDKEITPWSGMVFMKKLLDQTGIFTQLNGSDLPKQGSNRVYDPVQLITSFMVSIWCGANRQLVLKPKLQAVNYLDLRLIFCLLVKILFLDFV